MLTLYTAVGTLKFQKTTGGKSIPLVINDGQEYGLSDDELLLWSCLAFQILTLHELQDAYTLRQIQKEGPKGLSFQHYLNRLSLRGLVVSGIGLTGVDALYRLLGSLTIIPLKDTFPIRLFGCVQLYLEGTIGAKEFGRYLKKKPSSPMEDTILKLADKVSLTTAELVTSMEQEKVIHNESDIMDLLPFFFDKDFLICPIPEEQNIQIILNNRQFTERNHKLFIPFFCPCFWCILLFPF